MCISYIVKQVTSPGTSTFGSNLRLKLKEAICQSRCLHIAFDSLCLKYQNDRVTVMSSERRFSRSNLRLWQRHLQDNAAWLDLDSRARDPSTCRSSALICSVNFIRQIPCCCVIVGDSTSGVTRSDATRGPPLSCYFRQRNVLSFYPVTEHFQSSG